MTIRTIHIGSAVKFAALASAIWALLTGGPVTLVSIVAGRQMLLLLAPLLRLLGWSVADAIASTTTTLLSLLLLYVIALTLFGVLFLALFTLAYNLMARWTGGLAIQLQEGHPAPRPQGEEREASA